MGHNASVLITVKLHKNLVFIQTNPFLNVVQRLVKKRMDYDYVHQRWLYSRKNKSLLKNIYIC